MRRQSWPRVAILVVAGLVVSSQGFLLGYKRPEAATRLEARKRSRVNAGDEEIRYYHQGEQMMARELEATSPPPTAEPDPVMAVGTRSFATERRQSHLDRDRRVMKIGEDERAYYDRLNAYKGDRPLPVSPPPQAVVNIPKDKVSSSASKERTSYPNRGCIMREDIMGSMF